MARFEDLGTRPEGAARVAAAVDLLERGGLLAHPTGTVYGIGGPAGPRADAEVERLKGREGAPVLRIVADIGRLRTRYPDAAWPEEADRLADRFWPGPLTLVLDDGSATGLAVRVEAHPLTRAVLSAWGGALGSTSLNRSGRPPARTESEARTTLREMPEARLDVAFLPAGDLDGPPPSTLVSLREAAPRLLRVGAIPVPAIEAALGRRLEA
jgi:L-threonylcarbamoyladenylate synthase